ASLGQAYAQWVSNEDFGMVSFPPPLAPDRLKFLEGYGLGGPGRRGGILSDAVISRATVPTAAGPGEPQAMSMRAEQGTGAVASPAPAPPAAALVELRGNFAETAFWMPHLLTDSSGSGAIEFTVPDSVTSWKVWVHAVTRDLKAGSVEKEAQS